MWKGNPLFQAVIQALNLRPEAQICEAALLICSLVHCPSQSYRAVRVYSIKSSSARSKAHLQGPPRVDLTAQPLVLAF